MPRGSGCVCSAIRSWGGPDPSIANLQIEADMTGAVAGDHDACIRQHQRQRDCREVHGRSLAMSLMIPTDSAEGAMHASNEDWGGTCHTWSGDLRPSAWGWLLSGTTPWQWTAGTGRRRMLRSSWRRGTTGWDRCPSAPHLRSPSPNDVGTVVFPRGAASQAFQAGRGGRD